MFDFVIGEVIEGYLKKGLKNGSKKYKIEIGHLQMIISLNTETDTPYYAYYQIKPNENNKLDFVADIEFKTDILGVKPDREDLLGKEVMATPYIINALHNLCIEYNVKPEDISIVVEVKNIEGSDTIIVLPYNDIAQVKDKDGKVIILPMTYFLKEPIQTTN